MLKASNRCHSPQWMKQRKFIMFYRKMVRFRLPSKKKKREKKKPFACIKIDLKSEDYGKCSNKFVRKYQSISQLQSYRIWCFKPMYAFSSAIFLSFFFVVVGKKTFVFMRNWNDQRFEFWLQNMCRKKKEEKSMQIGDSIKSRRVRMWKRESKHRTPDGNSMREKLCTF